MLAVTKLLSKILCRDKHVFAVTKVSLSQQNFCCSKIMFVVTNISCDKSCYNKNMLRQKFCRDKNTFVVTKDTFCHDKQQTHLLQQKLYLWQLPPMIQNSMQEK